DADVAASFFRVARPAQTREGAGGGAIGRNGATTGGRGELSRVDGDGRAGAGSLGAVGEVAGRESEAAVGAEKDRQVGGAGGQSGSRRQGGCRVAGTQSDGVAHGIDQVPER